MFSLGTCGVIFSFFFATSFQVYMLVISLTFPFSSVFWLNFNPVLLFGIGHHCLFGPITRQPLSVRQAVLFAARTHSAPRPPATCGLNCNYTGRIPRSSTIGSSRTPSSANQVMAWTRTPSPTIQFCVVVVVYRTNLYLSFFILLRWEASLEV